MDWIPEKKQTKIEKKAETKLNIYQMWMHGMKRIERPHLVVTEAG